MDSTVAEPVSLARYHASANPTTELPNMEKAWLVQITKNFLIIVTPLKDTLKAGFVDYMCSAKWCQSIGFSSGF
jgi:hypothetical protein